MAQESKSAPSKGPISTAPEPEASRPDNFTPMKVEVHRDAPDGEALYWCGTLLEQGEFEMKWPASLQEIDAGLQPDEAGNYWKLIKTSAWKLWFTGTDIGRFWAARNGYYQTLDVTGLSFPAFTERSEKGGTNEAQTHTEVWPGTVVRISDSALSGILESIKNHAIRPKGQKWSSHPGAEIVNYKAGHMPGCAGGLKLTSSICPTCREIETKIPDSNAMARRVSNMHPEFRQRGDMPMADHVYLLKLKAPVTTPRDLYHRQVPNLAQFFMDQPPALSKDLNAAEKAA